MHIPRKTIIATSRSKSILPFSPAWRFRLEPVPVLCLGTAALSVWQQSLIDKMKTADLDRKAIPWPFSDLQ